MKKIFTILALAALVMISDSVIKPELSFAANPASARVKLGLKPNKRGIRANLRVIHTFRQEVETGGTCTVSLQACVTKFVPKGFGGGNNRSCEPETIATATIGEGETQHRFVANRVPLMRRSRKGNARQINVRTSAECTDSDSLTETIVSNGRARKASRNRRGGASPKFFMLLYDNRVD